MKEKLRKIFCWKPSEKLIAILAAAAVALMLIPLLRLCAYAVPWFDDYSYAGYVKSDYSQTCTLFDALRGGVTAAVDEWRHWEGTYFSVFLGTLVPIIWGDDKYFLGPAFLILFLTVSVMVLTRVFIRNILHGEFWPGLIVQAGSAAMIVMFIYSAQRGFYWYDGGAFYVALSSFAMLLAAAMIKLLTAEKRSLVIFWMIISILCAAAVGGGNYVTILQGLVFVLSFLGWVIWKRRERVLRVVPVVLVYLGAFALTVFAPGNSVRGDVYTDWGLPPVQAVLYSFVEAAKRFPEMTRWITLAALVLLAPAMLQIVRKTDFQFRHPLLVVLWTVCLYASGYTPGLYALGSVVLDRMLCTIKITLQLCLLLDEIYLLGWFCQKCRAWREAQDGVKGQKIKRQPPEAEPEGRPYWWFYPLMGVIMIFIFSTESNQADNYSAYGAYYYIHTGEAYNFYQEYLARLEVLRSDEPDVVLEPYRWRPWMICAGDLADYPEADENQAIAFWYNKNSVVCKPAQ